MIQREDLRRRLRAVIDGLVSMLGGAWLMALYFSRTVPDFREHADPIKQGLWLAIVVLLILRPREEKAAATGELSPRWSGVPVVLATGLGAAMLVAMEPIGQTMLAAGIAIATLVLAAVVWRFATTHAAEIGEARFDSATGTRVD